MFALLWPFGEVVEEGKPSFSHYVRVRNGNGASGDGLEAHEVVREQALEPSLRNVFEVGTKTRLNDGRRVKCLAAPDPACFERLRAQAYTLAIQRPIQTARYARVRALDAEWSEPLRVVPCPKGPAAAAILEVALLRDNARPEARAKAVKWVDECEEECIRDARQMLDGESHLGDVSWIVEREIRRTRKHWGTIREAMGVGAAEEED